VAFDSELSQSDTTAGVGNSPAQEWYFGGVALGVRSKFLLDSSAIESADDASFRSSDKHKLR